MAVGSRMLDFDVWFRFDIGSHCSDGHLCWVPVGAKKKPPPPESKVEECGTVSATKSPGAFFPPPTKQCLNFGLQGERGAGFFFAPTGLEIIGFQPNCNRIMLIAIPGGAVISHTRTRCFIPI